MADGELVAVVGDVLDQQPRPVVTVKDVAERLDLTEEQTRDRLNTLAEEGVINRSLLGNAKLTVYWVPESESDDSPPDEDDEDDV